MNFSEPFAVTADGKTTVFKNSTELWNWCIKNKPNWVQSPNTNYIIDIEDGDTHKIALSSGINLARIVLDEESYISLNGPRLRNML